MLVAPAGWGKTTLLAQWATEPDQRPRTAWVSLDRSDDEPVRFWTYVLTALGDLDPTVGGRALTALSAPGVDPVTVALPLLLNDLAASTGRYVLVLDDVHVLSDRGVWEGLEFLLTYVPPSLRVVMAGRADPRTALARLRARGELTEIRAADLRSPSRSRRPRSPRSVACACRSPRWCGCGDAPRGGRSGCSWPRCPPGAPIGPSPRSIGCAATTGTSWTTSDRRSWTSWLRSSATCWSGRRSWIACPDPCAMRCSGARARSTSCGSWRTRTSSWRHWIPVDAGTGVTPCCATCCGGSSGPPVPTRSRRCSAGPPTGTPARGGPTRPSGT